ncbi:hypothetical protein RF11_00339 [Thelohanellus kitauei]|uniref:Uncharacterized protein n=1 Tax=Thelohanellus kitauei TaxID=669202 RepID=A0A0C2JEW7_THEKT|nr:hypothetical protein RF11_00339 [Thelohanellus kitauei]
MDFENIRPKKRCVLENLKEGSPCNGTQLTDPSGATKILGSIGSLAKGIVNEESTGDSEDTNDPDDTSNPNSLQMINDDDHVEFLRICSDTLRHIHMCESECRKMFVSFRTSRETIFENKEESLNVGVADVHGNSRQNKTVNIIDESNCIMFPYNFRSMIVWNPDHHKRWSYKRKHSQKMKIFLEMDILNTTTKTNPTQNNLFIIDNIDRRSMESNVRGEFPVIENIFQVFQHQNEIMEDNSSFNTTKRIAESTPVHSYKTELHSNSNVQNYLDVDTLTKVNDSANINYQNSKIGSHQAEPLFDQGNDLTSSDTIIFSSINYWHLIFSDVNYRNIQMYINPISDDSDQPLSILSISRTPDSYYEDDLDIWSQPDSCDFYFHFDTLSFSYSENPDLQSTFLHDAVLGNNEREFCSQMHLDSVDSDSRFDISRYPSLDYDDPIYISRVPYSEDADPEFARLSNAYSYYIAAELGIQRFPVSRNLDTEFSH